MAKNKRLEPALLFDAIFHQAPIGIAIAYGDKPSEVGSGLVEINSMFEQITGRTKEELQALGWVRITHPDDLGADLHNYRRFQAGEIEGYAMDKRFIRPDGDVVWVHLTVAPLKIAESHRYNHIAIIRDITAQRKTKQALLESERSKSVLLSNLPGMAYRCRHDRDWTMEYVSAGCRELTGYPPESLVGNRDLSFNDLIAPEYRRLIREKWEHLLPDRRRFRHEYEIVTATGKRKWVLEMGQAVFTQGGVEALEGIILDISDRKEVENNLRYNLEHDRDTGLYNRRFLEDLLARNTVRLPARKRALVGIDLSPVQLLVKTHGFHYTRDLIGLVAYALDAHCVGKHYLFKSYENQFVFYLTDYGNRESLEAFCKSVGKTLGTFPTLKKVGGGIGVLEINRHNDAEADDLLKRLVIACERAVDVYDGNFEICFYDAAMETRIAREKQIECLLSEVALDPRNTALFLQFQPIVEPASNRITRFEALARLCCPKCGLVPPLEFIPVAERTRLIILIGAGIFHRAFNFLHRMHKRGYHNIGVSVNVSAIQLLKDGFTAHLLQMIKEMRVPPENVGLEITESLLATNYTEINHIIGRLQRAGLHIAIDDFGTGWSSLARGRELNVDCLKIDKSFIDKLLSVEPEAAITGNIISMAHKLGHTTVAEGVEHEKQRRYLIRHGCDRIQGYLISKPLGEEAALRLLAETNPRP